jgi:ribosomal protein S18 acetylase RimI-like enzyme
VAVADVNVRNDITETAHQSSTFQSRFCSEYTLEALTTLYNNTRIDYIVPMPMNVRRFAEYIHDYDVQVNDSIVITDEQNKPIGIGMLGLRDRRAWITRLGVHPDYRMKGVGRLLMRALIARARARGAAQVQLEVISGNEPAIRLFQRTGFAPVRELLVLNRPPLKIENNPPHDILIEPLSIPQLEPFLRQHRLCKPSWLDEAPSLLKSPDLLGFVAHHRNGSTGWIALRKNRFQLSHFVLDVKPDCPHEIALALLDTVHRTFPTLDTKYENLDATSPALPAMQSMGYIEVFRRIEMTMSLNP